MKEHRQITEILDQVEEHLPVGSKIIVACSGGADSIALADALLLLQEKRKYQLVVCHVEHGLRGSEALADADFVVEFCRMRQVACEVLRVDAKKFAAESKLSVEDAARKLRYTVLFEILSKHKSEYIVTAHHRDDQAETLLLHLLRGSGAEGLGGMRCHNNSIVRPFLQVSRRMLEAYCAMEKALAENNALADVIVLTAVIWICTIRGIKCGIYCCLCWNGNSILISNRL